MAQEEQGEGWSTIDVSKPNQADTKVEFEIEEAPKQAKAEESKTSPKETQAEAEKQVEVKQQETKPTAQKEEQTEVAPEELKGIETNGAQKRIKQLIRQRKERDEEIARLRAEVEESRKKYYEKDTQLVSAFRNQIDSTETQLTQNIEKAKRAFKIAVEQNDTDGMVTAQEEISKNYADAAAIREKKKAWEEYQAQLEAQAKAQPKAVEQRQQQYDPKAIQWASKNSWFGKDQVKTQAALDVDAQLKEEGFDPSDDEYYDEVDKRLLEQYNIRPASRTSAAQEQNEEVQEQEPPRLQNAKTKTNSAPIVSGASRTSKTSTGSGPKVKLTQEDVRLANKWGISLEKYAAEKLKVQEADGEYTTIN